VKNANSSEEKEFFVLYAKIQNTNKDKASYKIFLKKSILRAAE